MIVSACLYTIAHTSANRSANSNSSSISRTVCIQCENGRGIEDSQVVFRLGFDFIKLYLSFLSSHFQSACAMHNKYAVMQIDVKHFWLNRFNHRNDQKICVCECVRVLVCIGANFR